MNNSQRKTLAKIFQEPIATNIPWQDIESLFLGLGAEMKKGRGSRVGVKLNQARGFFHSPHPEKETSRGAVEAVKDFFIRAGITPKE